MTTQVPLAVAKVDDQPTAVRRPSTLFILLSDPGACLALLFVLLAVLAAVFAPLVAPTDPYSNDLANTLKSPSEFGGLGADTQGRDMITRLLYGLRMSLLLSVASVLIGCTTGGAVGFVAAFYPRLTGPVMRLMDVLLSFPAILFALAVASIFGPGVATVIIALVVASLPSTARVMWSAAIVVLQQDYIESARSIGMSNGRILRKYLLPNCLSTVLVVVTMSFGQVILFGAALSFLGLGVQPPVAELGAMAAEGRDVLFFAPHITALPCFLIFLIVLAFNVLGDALRDAFDPKLRR
ncbi:MULTISPECIES: ABC transporter permease [unclassified Bradyrhizobium]|uniref:ABC transporter permease n=1 Tax=Bradyrhizobium sp. USDA 4541 TaxID=2817704 RepID=UPI0020A54EC5|nr:ABC transporter permease [Bradyrhizobium sp. USDA 4541]MCP1848127.1 peptide/nickel transport system permease protein [Bradyrhizobium sp. USDA 4541]